MSIRSAAIVSLAGALFLAGGAQAGDKTFSKRTYTYKTVGAVKIEADVYRPDDTKTRPVVVWLHGGALIVGHRDWVPKQVVDLCRNEGFALVSFDYRLAPEVKLVDIIEDINDAFRWLEKEAPNLLHVDPKRIVVAGGSAGGYLTLMTGFAITPRPVALVAFWGYGDVDGDWYTRPSDHYRTAAQLVSPEEATKAVGASVLTGTSAGEEQKARGRYYLYLRQNGLWTSHVTGVDPAKERGKLDRFCPVRNVTESFPPTLLVHGTEDTDVPYQLSVDMAKELARHNVPHELVTVRGAGHGLAGGDRKLIEEANARAADFMRKHLQKAVP